MKSWVRLWLDMPTDPKFRVIAKRSGRPLSEVIAVFVVMMTKADDDGSISGWSSEDVAAALDTEAEHVEAIYKAMQDKVLDGDSLSGWQKRQPKREDASTDRVRAFRGRMKRNETQRNADETQSNAPDPYPDSDVSLRTSLPSEQEVETAKAREGKVDFVGVGLGKGGVVSPEARRKVAARLAIATADPLVALFDAWEGSRRARDVDGMFIRSAGRFFRDAPPEVKAACQPHAEMSSAIPFPVKPIPQASSALRASLRRMS